MLLQNDNCSSGVFKGDQHGRGCCLHFLLRGTMVEVCRKYCKQFFQDIEGDIAAWEREDGWETVGKVETVMLRLFISMYTRQHYLMPFQEGRHLLYDRAGRRPKDDFPSENLLVESRRPLQEVWRTTSHRRQCFGCRRDFCNG